MSIPSLIPIARGAVSPSRCKHCGTSIYWVTLAATRRGGKARSVPFERRPVVVRTETNETTLVRVDFISPEGRHACQARRRVVQRAKAQQRIREASASGQGRMF